MVGSRWAGSLGGSSVGVVEVEGGSPADVDGGCISVFDSGSGRSWEVILG